jgi:hypothetical protein
VLAAEEVADEGGEERRDRAVGEAEEDGVSAKGKVRKAGACRAMPTTAAGFRPVRSERAPMRSRPASAPAPTALIAEAAVSAEKPRSRVKGTMWTRGKNTGSHVAVKAAASCAILTRAAPRKRPPRARTPRGPQRSVSRPARKPQRQ